ncbi:MAG TPA: ribonuclease H family protein, partial [Anaerolineales bacterium]|nr:ribonuclease H family protein [Anaerolineales bacterium]
MASPKFYVVWKGRKRGIFTSWVECERQVKGYVGAEFKAFGSLAEAKAALARGYEHYRGKSASQGRWKALLGGPRLPSISVDAACSGSPGPMEFRGVDTESGRQIFRHGPFAEGTNNVGEFLAIVEGLRWLGQHPQVQPIYSDSENAIGWVRQGKCRTNLRRTAANRLLFEMIARAEAELPQL